MRHFMILIYARLIENFRHLLLKYESTIKFLYLPGIMPFRSFNAKIRAYSEFIHARNSVPGYREFLRNHGFGIPSFSGLVPNIAEIPITDKNSYVKLFTMKDRCVGGEVPSRGVVIDESSGSSGQATNWIRSNHERETNAQFIKFGIKKLFGEEPLFILNAFALGPWATGMNISMSCVDFATVKSIGPDRAKIENTLRNFGTDHKYVIMGYPPFLKSMVDHSDIVWSQYDVSFIFGGESMSEGMRDYLLSKGIKKIYSSFGASDLELNIAAENDFTISLRRLIRSNPLLAKEMLQFPGALPMVFQYNPSDFFIESTTDGELVITLCRPGYIAPKIRYNIHDRGHTMDIEKLFEIMDSLGISRDSIETPATDLPLLLHYGRADMTVSFFGSNISPNDIQELICSDENLMNRIHSFCMKIDEDQNGTKNLHVMLECMFEQTIDLELEPTFKDYFFDKLTLINQDFREAKRMMSSSDQLIISILGYGKGHFAENDIRIKSKYIA